MLDTTLNRTFNEHFVFMLLAFAISGQDSSACNFTDVTSTSLARIAQRAILQTVTSTSLARIAQCAILQTVTLTF